MRLRLRIERNNLPTVSTLWPVSDTQVKHTVSQLLELVDKTFPLESTTWGLEHYIATINGFELLHYHELGAVCKDDDEVVIRPLGYAENRGRRLNGREQITADGRHLLDGLPFGKPKLRGVNRPDVWIPPRPRSVEEMREELLEAAAVPMSVAILTEVEESMLEEDEDDEDDVDFGVVEEIEESDASEEDSSEEDSSEDEVMDESAAKSDSSSETSEASSSSDSSSDEDESMSEASWNGIETAPPTPHAKKSALKTKINSRVKTPATAVASTTSHGEYDPSKDAILSSRVANLLDKLKKQNNTPPFQGKPETRSRNARKRDTRKLAHLKQIGVLHRDASLTTLHQWENSHKNEMTHSDEGMVKQNDAEASEVKVNGAEAEAESIEKLDPMLVDEDNADVKPTEVSQVSDEHFDEDKQVQLKRQRQDLLKAIASGGVDITEKPKKRKRPEAAEDDEPPEEVSAKRTAIEPVATRKQVSPTPETPAKPDPKPVAAKPTDMVPASVARRSKLDLASSQRLVFGSLGMRMPKTQEEKDALQKKLAEKAKKRIAPPTVASPAIAPEAETVAGAVDIEENAEDAWRDKIELSAVECCDEGVTLSTPPFPFYQRWDPKQRKKKSKARTGKAYTAKKGSNGVHVESYDKYNTNGGGDALDYDDAEEEDDEYWEEGALLDGEYDDDDQDDAAKQLQRETNEQVQEEDFPPLPEKVADLALLAESDAKLGDIVVYSELACSAATNWQPSMLTRTVQLAGHDDVSWMLKQALRDMPAKEYDDDGKRVYEKFEMEGASDDEGGEEDDRMKQAKWSELGEVRLLLRAQTAEVEETNGSA
ncbi:hypothetical protein LTR97_008346 [Elasticomyces elasticus]|uniref:DUF7357 domain-containing protein n=1 Tax=Elasticomyces elasticus TaxID=574655 RepID=A0AAN7ZMG0_9PEZI|nr:hypothetical protein LTR97_008346 [Elasticomyces elasticus]